MDSNADTASQIIKAHDFIHGNPFVLLPALYVAYFQISMKQGALSVFSFRN